MSKLQSHHTSDIRSCEPSSSQPSLLYLIGLKLDYEDDPSDDEDEEAAESEGEEEEEEESEEESFEDAMENLTIADEQPRPVAVAA